MKGEVGSHLNKMEESLIKIRKEEETFDKNFLKRQNQTFDAVDNFIAPEKR